MISFDSICSTSKKRFKAIMALLWFLEQKCISNISFRRGQSTTGQWRHIEYLDIAMLKHSNLISTFYAELYRQIRYKK